MGARNTPSQPRRAPQQAIATLIAATLLAAPSLSPALELADVASGKHGFVVNGTNAYDLAGTTVAGVGDVNGDGLDDMVVIADPLVEGVGTSGTANKCYVVFGRTGTSPLDFSDVESGLAGFMVLGTPGFDSASSAAGLGDVNNDGLDDFAVGCPMTSPEGRAEAGAVFVVFGKQDTAAVNAADLTAGLGGYAIYGANAGDRSGKKISATGDVNGDGFSDLLVNNGSLMEFGYVSVVFGKSGTAAVQLSDVGSGVGGYRVTSVFRDYGAAAGDVNGDGHGDIVVASYGSFRSQVVVFGKANTAAVDASTAGAGAGGFEIQGAIEAGAAGDVNGDGLGDVFATIPNPLPTGGTPRNWCIIFGKQDTSPIHTADIVAGLGGFAIPLGATGAVGTPAAAGDVNGDGLDDVVAPGGPVAQRNAAHVVYGKTQNTGVAPPDLLSGIGGFIINQILYDYHYGFGSVAGSVASAGDVNGDGFSDVIIGDPRATPGAMDIAGTAFIVFGGNPPFADADSDGLTDYAETNTGLLARPWNTGTDPNQADSDLDGINDGAEILLGANPLDRKVSPSPQPYQHIVTESSILEGNRGFVINGRSGGDWAGFSVAGAGDVNADGIDDVIVGAPRAISVGSFRAGEVYVVFGSRTPRSVELSNVVRGIGGFVIRGKSRGAGHEVSKAGDVNGDGFDDLLILTVDLMDSINIADSVYVVFGKSNTAPVSLSAVEAGLGGGFAILDQSGYFANYYEGRNQIICGLGDMNGDGFDDIGLAAPTLDTGSDQILPVDNHAGAVVFGKAGAAPVHLSDVYSGIGGFPILGETTFSERYDKISNAGDVNNDEINDIILVDQSHVPYVIFGKADTAAVQLSTVASGIGGFVITVPESPDWIAAGAGDVNGDGFADLVLGSYQISQDHAPESGECYVVFGKPNTNPVELAAIASGSGGFIIRGALSSGHAGGELSEAGDVNGDGLSDIIIPTFLDGSSPAESFDPNRSCFVVYGKLDTFPVDLFGIQYGAGGFVIRGWPGLESRAFSGSVSGAGDINGDGIDDVIVGDSAEFSDLEPFGHAYIIYGFKTKAPDSDQDLIPDYAETGNGSFVDSDDTGTGRNNPDSDGDGVLDGIEVDLGTDPNNPLDFPILPLYAHWILAVAAGVAGVWLIVRRASRRSI